MLVKMLIAVMATGVDCMFVWRLRGCLTDSFLRVTGEDQLQLPQLGIELNAQAVAEIESTDASGIKTLHNFEGRAHALQS